MKTVDISLWNKIRNFELDDIDSDFTFSNRLARENDWSTEYSLRCIEEYKRFIFLICKTSHPLTPSDQVDQVWHLHLLYTQSYWEDFCGNTLDKQIHHGPTKGGSEEKSKYKDWYAETKNVYLESFKEKPPADIWPKSEIRFGEIQFSRVNRHRNWIIPKFHKKK